METPFDRPGPGNYKDISDLQLRQEQIEIVTPFGEAEHSVDSNIFSEPSLSKHNIISLDWSSPGLGINGECVLSVVSQEKNRVLFLTRAFGKWRPLYSLHPPQIPESSTLDIQSVHWCPHQPSSLNKLGSVLAVALSEGTVGLWMIRPFSDIPPLASAHGNISEPIPIDAHPVCNYYGALNLCKHIPINPRRCQDLRVGVWLASTGTCACCLRL
jgi:hypothetical protein